MAKIGQLGSRSDLEALRRSGRGKLAILGVTVAVALGGALWAFTRDGGTGNPEDPAKILIVRSGGTKGYAIVLEDVGFDAAEGTFADWERKAGEEVPELEATGAAAIMQLADRFGYGFVVFEDPGDIDFGGLEVELPALEAHHRFAVMSAGDLAFPHEVTVNPPPSDVVRDPAVLMMQALFEQERLAATREIVGSGLDALKLRDRLSAAIDKIDRVPKGERLAATIEQQIEDMLVGEERARPHPVLLGGPLESSTAVALANGSVLIVARELSIVSNDGVRPDLDLGSAERFWALRPAAGDRAACAALAGGVVEDADSLRYRASADGGALLLRTLSDGLVLWRLEPPPPQGAAAADDGCRFVRVGRVPPSRKGLDLNGAPRSSGAVARGGRVDGEGIVEIVRAGADERRVLGMIEGAQLQIPAWVDDAHLIARSRHPSAPDALHVLSTERPDLVLTIPAAAFDGAQRIGAVAVGPPTAQADGAPARRTVVVTAGDDPRGVYAFSLPAPIASVFDAPPEAEGAERTEREGKPTLVTLAPAELDVRPLTHQGVARDPVVSPDGRLVAFTIVDPELDRPDAAGDDEIALVALDGSFPGMKLLTQNALRDLHPQFVADGSAVIVETRVPIPRTSWVITAARRVATPAPPPPRVEPTGDDAKRAAPANGSRPVAEGRADD